MITTLSKGSDFYFLNLQSAAGGGEKYDRTGKENLSMLSM